MPYLVGLVSSFIVATLVTYSKVSLGWDPMTLWFNLILPFGALCCGFLAGLGFLIGGKAGNAETSLPLAVFMLVGAAVTFVAIDIFYYYAAKAGGVPLSELIGLDDYLQLRWTHSSMTIGHGQSANTFDLGKAGFLLPFGKALGFGVGYWANFGLIGRRIYYEA